MLDKTLWTHEDFDKMLWHDVTIHAITFNPAQVEFILDIDYMFEWVNPGPTEKYYSFWLSPATLVFEKICNFQANFADAPLGLSIFSLTRNASRSPRNASDADLSTEWTWIIDLLQGEITFSSIGFTLFIRKPPILINAQQFTSIERGGISFDRNIEQ